ncbi:unnamed protein product [Parnassius apollo]|uniref:(apollo) hypothetical protein n=1 Tax=Parnassius apollo TaxID=110799 RepID=A0A8S3WT85_PARAO|nr:unnamed protein product [Parnassius apollo]
MPYLGLKNFAKKAVWRYSMGMRRRLAIGCVLFASTPVKLLDDPTAGIDVAAKHLVWTEIKRGLSNDDAVVLSSHNMEEVERLCNRLAVLDSGETGTLESTNSFKNLYAPGRTVFFKFRITVLYAAGTLRVQSLKDSMYREFSCYVNSEHLTTIWFTITEPKLAFNVIFVKLRKLATDFEDIVEDYSAYDGNMEDAFIHFMDENRYNIRPKETW